MTGERGSRRGGIVLTVATVAIGLGSIPGFLFGYLGSVFEDDLGISKPALGVLIGVFFGATGLASTVGGAWAERIGAHKAVGLDMLVVAAGLLLAVLVPTYPSLLVMAAATGAGYALSNAGTNMAVAASIAPARHGIAMAVRTAGVPAVGALQSLVGVAAAATFGWRPVLAVVVPVIVVVAVLCFWLLPAARSSGDPAAAVVEAHDLVGDGPGTPRRVRLPAGFLWYPVAAFLLIAGTQPIYSWSVLYLDEVGGLSVPMAGALASVGSAVAVVAMIVLAGRADRTGGDRVRPVVLLTAASAVGVALLWLGILAGPVSMTAGLVLGGLAQLTAIGLMHAAVVATAPHLVGRASGATMAGYYLGALLSAPLFGLSVDATGGYGLGWGVSVALTAASVLCFVRCRSVTARAQAARTG
ncbi:MFS transporter [Pseudonocardia sulfidoxydans NBRC 16205]|uniref:MFS transporter n=1 Tax=Pseudonocardia sulfidoxydans NBRC 16205 TaxID=1223511 RepID=A0A511DPC7_9PSEU|nr:MFS transporter [Pseudonocardia sulfidoxydans]GEL26671.1 MFS transporter [Pseudonocardia sulfidoxydans NBRC 16205]